MVPDLEIDRNIFALAASAWPAARARSRASISHLGAGFTVSVGKTEISVFFFVFATHWEANFGPENG